MYTELMDTKQIETAGVYEIQNPEAVASAKQAMPCSEAIEKLADFYKIMGDQTRLKILTALEAGELCVSDLAELVSMSRSAVSHQLRALKAAKLVKNRKDGKTVYYSLDDEHIHSIIKVAVAHILEEG